MTKYQILTLNQISSHGLHRFPSTHYAVGKAVAEPDAILVRSHDMHAMTIPASVKAIGRAGAGTNNIPVAELSKRGVPVFNAPGAIHGGISCDLTLYIHCCSGEPDEIVSVGLIDFRPDERL